MSDQPVSLSNDYPTGISAQAVAFGLLVSVGIGASIVLHSGLLGHLATTPAETPVLTPTEVCRQADVSVDGLMKP